MFEKILVPLDTSKLAEVVLPHATQLAREFGSEVDIVVICEPQETSEGETCSLYMDSQAENLRTAIGVPGSRIRTELITGSPAQKIIEYTLSRKIDILFLSSHGRSGVLLWPIGGTVDKVLRKTGVPLIIVNVKDSQKGSLETGLFRRILIPLDGSERGAAVLPYVREISQKISSEVVLFHVVDTGRKVHSLGRLDSVPFREDELDSLRKRSEEYLTQESRRFAGTKATVNTVVKTGNVAQEIIKYAVEKDCSLIAVSSHGHSGFESWMIGSVTNKVLHSADKSLFYVPALESPK